MDRGAHILALKNRLKIAREKIGEGPFKAACECLQIDIATGPRGTPQFEALVAECEDMAGGGAA